MELKIFTYFFFFALLFSKEVIAQNNEIVTANSEWEYYDHSKPPEQKWNTNLKSQKTLWKSGKSLLGYGDQVHSTVLRKTKTCYFRKKIFLSDVSEIRFYDVKLTYSDGLILYLNGREIFRSNVPRENTESISVVKRDGFVDPIVLRITPEELIQGENILAAEVYTADDSEVLSFGLEIFGSFEENVKLIASGDSWYYYDKIMPENEQWFFKFNPNFNWKKGYSELGYGDKDESTVIEYGANSEKKIITSYFLKEINIPDPSLHVGYLLTMKVDDGAVVYLNGNEIWRINMPSGSITRNTLAEFRIINEKEERIHTFIINPEMLISGENTIAVSVHQNNPNSTDCSFWAEFVGIENIKLIHKFFKNEDAKLSKQLIELKDQMLIRDKELEIKGKDQELQLNRFYVSATIGIIVILLIATLIFWFSQKQRNKKIAENNALLKDELIGKNQELINMSLEQLNKNRFIHDLESDLSNVEKGKDSERLLSQLKNKLSSYSVQDKNWENLQLHFQNVHSDYFAKLKVDFPGLNSTELRFCGYIRLQLTTKEIAEILSVEPRSVQTSRYRLKKKLNIPSHTDLIQFLSRYY